MAALHDHSARSGSAGRADALCNDRVLRAQNMLWQHALTDDRGAQIVFGLGVGSTYSTTAGAWANGDYNSATGATAGVSSTSSATWKITGIQFEAGDTMTPFEFLDRKEVLDDCLRYFYRCHRCSFSY